MALTAADAEAGRIVDFWAEKARLKPAGAAGGEPAPIRILAATGEIHESPARGRPELRLPGNLPAGPGDAICPFEPPGAPKPPSRIVLLKARENGVETVSEPLSEEEWFWKQLARFSACIGRAVQARGGVLIHSGLAAFVSEPGGEPRGFLLAGRSGVGKSTAGRRLTAPWLSLADDITLIVRPSAGNYRAHPFPTWSRFFGQDAGDGSDIWDVQRSVPLQTVFVLEQGEKDRIEPLGSGHALSLLVELAGQTSARFVSEFTLDELSAFNQERFDNLAALVKSLPAFFLHVKLGSAFWEEIGRVLTLR